MWEVTDLSNPKPCSNTHTRAYKTLPDTHTQAHTASSQGHRWGEYENTIERSLKLPHPDIHFSSSFTHTHQICSWPWCLLTGPLDSHADDIISIVCMQGRRRREGGRGCFTALLETVWRGELSGKQRAMDEWNRMTDSEGKEHTHAPTNTAIHTLTHTHTHTVSHVFLLNSWGKISLSCNDF